MTAFTSGAPQAATHGGARTDSGAWHVSGVERRGAPREAVSGAATMFCLGARHFGEIHPMRLLDYSHDGACLVGEAPIEPGCRITIGFEPMQCLAGRGVVLRSEPCDDGYHVAVRFLDHVR
jgi:hypothetical protein